MFGSLPICNQHFTGAAGEYQQIALLRSDIFGLPRMVLETNSFYDASCLDLALLGLGAMSDLSPFCAPNRTID